MAEVHHKLLRFGGCQLHALFSLTELSLQQESRWLIVNCSTENQCTPFLSLSFLICNMYVLIVLPPEFTLRLSEVITGKCY